MICRSCGRGIELAGGEWVHIATGHAVCQPSERIRATPSTPEAVSLPFVLDDVHRLRQITELMRQANAPPDAVAYLHNLTRAIERELRAAG